MADPQAQPKPRLPNAYTLDPNRKSGPFGGKGDHDGDGNVGGAKAAPRLVKLPKELTGKGKHNKAALRTKATSTS